MHERDVLGCLRALDLALADVAPSPRLGARISARLRAEAGARTWPPGGDLAWFVGPLGFAAAAAGAAFFLSRANPGDDRAADTAQPVEIRRDRLPPDAGPDDDDTPRRAAPRIHAPGLTHPSSREHAPVRPPSSRPPIPDEPRPPPWLDPIVDDAAPPAPSARPPRDAPRSAPPPPSGGSSLAPTRGPARIGPLGTLRGVAPGARPRGGEAAAFNVVPVGVVPVGSVLETAEALPDPACELPEVLELEAAVSCKEQGMVPSAFLFLDPCGDGRYRDVDPKCVPPPDGSGDSCTGGLLGDGATCVDEGSLEKEALTSCAAQGLVLSEVFADPTGCSGGARYAKYICCPPEVPSPSVSACFTMEIGDGGTCQKLATVAGEAHAICSSKTGTLTDLSIVKGCEGGGALVVSFTCCLGGDPGQ